MLINTGKGGTVGLLSLIQEKLKGTGAFIFLTMLFALTFAHAPTEFVDIVAVKKYAKEAQETKSNVAQEVVGPEVLGDSRQSISGPKVC